jgi:hypothetical protein
MNETLYKIKRSGGMESTTWIGATGCKRKFDPEVDVFIVNEIELGICLHHGNFKLLGPADITDVRESSITESESIAEEKVEFVVEEIEEVEEEEEDTSIEE